MSRGVYQVFPAATLQLIRRHLSLSEAFLSLTLRFSFSLMRFWNLSQAVCCLSACHRSFAHRQIWGVCVFCQAVDYSRPRDWCSLFNMFTCKTRFVGAVAAVCCFSPQLFPVIGGLNIEKWGSFSQVNTERKVFQLKSSSWNCCFWNCQMSVLAGLLLIQSEVVSDLRSQVRTLLRCHISPTLLFITRE